MNAYVAHIIVYHIPMQCLGEELRLLSSIKLDDNYEIEVLVAYLLEPNVPLLDR